METVKVLGEGDSEIHVPSPQAGIITLCGWCDVDCVSTQAKPTCPACLRIVSYCKSLKIRQSTLAQVKQF